MKIADEINIKLGSKQGRIDLLNTINDNVFLGSVAELTRNLEKRGQVEEANKVVKLENGATYLQILANLAIKKINQLEGN